MESAKYGINWVSIPNVLLRVNARDEKLDSGCRIGTIIGEGRNVWLSDKGKNDRGVAAEKI